MRKEIPILFSTQMVQEILAGRKTMTRRIVKPQPYENTSMCVGDFHPVVIDRNGDEQPGPATFGAISDDCELCVKCPYGKPGDILWVRESWFLHENSVQGSRAYTQGQKPTYPPHFLDKNGWKRCIDYKADYPKSQMKAKPSIHMPKEAARIWLEVTDVRVERLQDISEEDAKAEGVELVGTTTLGASTFKDYENERLFYYGAKPSFQSLWISINSPESWHANPWVWVVSFNVLSTTGKPSF